LLAAAAPLSWQWHLPLGVAPPPVPADNPMNAAKVDLGRRLFYDADLSFNGTMACSTCHEQAHGFADSVPTRPGIHGDPGRRNAIGLGNVAWRRYLTWADMHLNRLEAQVAIPLFNEHPVELGMKGAETEIGRRLGADSCYRSMFAKAFPERQGHIDLASVSAALAAFQRTLTSFDSPYDHFLAGQTSALSPTARRGAKLFDTLSCSSCHKGEDLTDDSLPSFDVGTVADRGLSEKTGDPADDGRFRTPSLRNVAVTGPYMHDGAARTIPEAIRRHPLPIAEPDMADLVAFLDSLTDRTFLTEPRFSRPQKACGHML
jgi:cytochrome c peroxidase